MKLLRFVSLTVAGTAFALGLAMGPATSADARAPNCYVKGCKVEGEVCTCCLQQQTTGEFPCHNQCGQVDCGD